MSVDDITRRLKAGESLESIVASFRLPSKSGLLARCAVVRTFDRQVVDQILRPGIPGASPDELPFEQLVSDHAVVTVSPSAGLYRIRSIESAWARENTNRDLHAKLLDYYRQKGKAWEADSLYHAVPLDADDAVRQFDDAWQDAERAFDLTRCQRLLEAFDAASRRLIDDASRQKLTARARRKHARLQALGLWADDYFRSARYLGRTSVDGMLDQLWDDDKPWLLHLFATGGMGKTMSLRHLLARRCVPNGVLCARVDFDTVRQDARGRLWPIFEEIARQLNVQVEDGPFEGVVRLASTLTEIARHQKSLDEVIEEKAGDVLAGFRSGLKSLDSVQRILIVLDTVENALFKPTVSLSTLLDEVTRLHTDHPGVRVIVAGRYDLRKRGFAGPPIDAAAIAEVPPFDAAERRAYLINRRQLADDERIGAVSAKSEGIPFKLALLADIIEAKPGITAQEIADYPDADLLYLIERVIERIVDERVQWVVRYGVVPRRLHKQFVVDVMSRYLPAATAGRSKFDNPAKDERPHRAGDRIFPPIPLRQEDIGGLWDALREYAAGSAWVSESTDHPDELVFHAEVLNPMRRLLEPHPIYRKLHEDAVTYYEARRKADWPRCTAEAIYHSLQLGGDEAEEYWRDRLKEARASGHPEWTAAIAAEILGPEYVNAEQVPLRHKDGTPIVSVTAITLANAEFALAHLDHIRARELDYSNDLWTAALDAYHRVTTLLSHGVKLPVAPARWARLEAAVLEARKDEAGAIRVLREATGRTRHEGDRARLYLQLGALKARTEPGAGVAEYKRALGFAERARPLEPDLVAQAGLALAQNLTLVDRLDEAIDAITQRLRRWPPRLRGRGEVTLSAIYIRAGFYTQGEALADRISPHAPADVAVMAHCAAARALLETARPTLGMRRLDLLAQMLGTRMDIDPALRKIAEAWRAELEAAARAQLLDPGAVELYEQAGRQYESVGAMTDAAVARHHLAQALMRDSGNLTAARQLLEPEIEGLPAERRTERTVLRAELTRRRGEPDQAAALLESALMSSPPRTPRHIVRLCMEALALGHSQGDAWIRRHVAMFAQALEQITPRAARAALLGPLTVVPELGTHAMPLARLLDMDTRGIVRLDPRERLMSELNLVEAYRVFGHRKEARTRLRAMLNYFEKRPTELLPLRRLLAAADRSDVKLEPSTGLIESFLHEHAPWPGIAGALLVECAERALKAGDEAAAQHAIEQAELQQASPSGPPSQWTARRLACRGRLLERQGDARGAVLNLKHAAAIYDVLQDGIGRDAVSGDAAVQEVFVDPTEEATIRIADGQDGPRVEIEGPSRDPSARMAIEWPDLFGLTGPMRGSRRMFMAAEGLAEGWRESSETLALRLGAAGLWRRLRDRSRSREPLRIRLETPDDLGCLPYELLWNRELRSPDNPHGFVACSEAVTAFFRARSRSVSLTGRIRALQASLRLATGMDLAVDGIADEELTHALRQFQHQAGLPQTGVADAGTREQIANRVQQRNRTSFPLALVVKPSRERQYRATRGDSYTGLPLEQFYARAGFEVQVIEDPSEAVSRRWHGRSPAVVHVHSSLNEDLLSGTTRLAFEAVYQELSDSDGSLLSARAIDRLIQSVSTAVTRPLVVLDTPWTRGDLEVAHQCLQRNTLAAELFQLASTPAIIALGLAPPGKQDMVYDTLTRGLKRAEPVGAIVMSIRRTVEPPSLRQSLDHVLGTLGAALFTDDPDWISFADGRSSAIV